MSGTEDDSLQAFGAAREQIHEVADNVYARGHKGSYADTLAAWDVGTGASLGGRSM